MNIQKIQKKYLLQQKKEQKPSHYCWRLSHEEGLQVQKVSWIQNGWTLRIKGIGRDLFLVERCDRVRVHGDHLKVYMTSDKIQSSWTKKHHRTIRLLLYL